MRIKMIICLLVVLILFSRYGQILYLHNYSIFERISYLQVKTGHFSEHSYQLWSISAVPSWPKINSGLVKMYQNEVSYVI